MCENAQCKFQLILKPDSKKFRSQRWQRSSFKQPSEQLWTENAGQENTRQTSASRVNRATDRQTTRDKHLLLPGQTSGAKSVDAKSAIVLTALYTTFTVTADNAQQECNKQ